jgi:hypothetical protein
MGILTSDSWLWSLTWKRNLRPAKIEQLQRLLDQIEGFKWKNNVADSKRWAHEKDGTYSVKTSRNLIDKIEYPRISSIPSNLLLKGITLPKIEVFNWLLLHGRVSTKEFLGRRHPSEEALCLFLFWQRHRIG